MAGLRNFSTGSKTTGKTMTGDEFVNEELGFDIENIDVPLVGDAVLDKVEGGPVEGQKSQGDAVDQGGQAQVPQGQADDFTAEDILLISDALINLPVMFWGKLPERDPNQVKTFSDQFYKYCIRKDINPFDYFFDEFGMAMAILPICKSYMDDYKEMYGKKSKEEKVKYELDKDHEHYTEVEKAKENAMKEREVEQNIAMDVKNNG